MGSFVRNGWTDPSRGSIALLPGVLPGARDTISASAVGSRRSSDSCSPWRIHQSFGRALYGCLVGDAAGASGTGSRRDRLVRRGRGSGRRNLRPRERAWAVIRGCAAAWVEPLAEDDDTPAVQWVRAEVMLGCALPAALREVRTLPGGRLDLIANQDPLVPAGEMFVPDGCGWCPRAGCLAGRAGPPPAVTRATSRGRAAVAARSMPARHRPRSMTG